jgi:hypothetical protein
LKGQIPQCSTQVFRCGFLPCLTTQGNSGTLWPSIKEFNCVLDPESTVTKDEILAQVAAGHISVDQASKLLDKADQAKKGTLYCKVSEKGAVSVYGLQRMPVTLYVEQWDRLLDFADQIRQFLKEHDSELKRKER